WQEVLPALHETSVSAQEAPGAAAAAPAKVGGVKHGGVRSQVTSSIRMSSIAASTVLSGAPSRALTRILKLALSGTRVSSRTSTGCQPRLRAVPPTDSAVTQVDPPLPLTST